MDVAWNYKRNILYVADSYNNKIKYVTGLDGHKQNHYSNGVGNATTGGIVVSTGGSVHTLPLPVKVC